MKLYIDSDFKCHRVNPDNAYLAVETDYFEGKCDAFVEGYRYIPRGESWTRSDGIVFQGEKAFPWKNFSELDAAQRSFEQALITDMQQALAVLGVTLDG